MKSQPGKIVKQLSPIMWEDADGDLIVVKNFLGVGLLVNYTRPSVTEIFEELRKEAKPDLKMIALGRSMMASRCPQYQAYHLVGPVVDIFKEEVTKQRQNPHKMTSEEFLKTPADQVPETFEASNGQMTVSSIRTGEDLTADLQKKVKFFDTIVAHIMYRDSLLPPREVHSTFVIG